MNVKGIFLGITLALAGNAFGERLMPRGDTTICIRPERVLAGRVDEPRLPSLQAGKKASGPKGFFIGAIEKNQEMKINYKPAFQEGGWQTVVEEKQYKIKASILNLFNARTGQKHTQLEVTVTDIEGDEVIAFQRQYAASEAALNTMVLDFRHPRTGEVYVVGIRR